MNSADFPISRYLDRIGLGKPPLSDVEGLREIHAAQSFSIPFENLDIHLGRTISLKSDALIDKILQRNRGGYCFELNGILLLALKALGFMVRPLLARVLYNRNEPGPYTHEVLIASISGQDWLADVGFGGPGPRLPLPMIPDRIHTQYKDRYRLQFGSDHGWVLQKSSPGGFFNLYTFQDLPLLDADIEMSNHFTSTWPDSIFRTHKMCAFPKPWGRVTLTDMELTINRDGRIIRRTLPAGPIYMDALVEHFGLALDAEYEEFIL